MPAYVLEIFVVALGLSLLVFEAFCGPQGKKRVAFLGIAGLSAAFVMLFFVRKHCCDSAFWSFYTDDAPALFFKGLALLCTIAVLVLSLDYAPVLEKFSARCGGGPAIGEFFALPVFICAGMMWMASASDLTSIFVSLELVTIAFYVLVGYMRRNSGSLEAGVKYLILGALSTCFFVYGISWLFGITGQTNLEEIGKALAATQEKTAALFAFGLLMVGLGFKLGAAPFHLWVPDVYQGAPTPVTAYLSVGSKAAGVLVAWRILQPFLAAPQLSPNATTILLVIAGATLVLGNLAAIPQYNFKRLLAYSSISHGGFLLLALAAKPEKFGISPQGVVSFYLAAYLFMTLLCFAVLGVVQREKGSDDLAAFDGLAKRSPFLAFALLIGVAGLAGVPLTAGFLGKFFVFALAVDSGFLWPTILAILGAAAGFYYYLKVVRCMYWNAPSADASGAAPAPISLCPLTKALIIALLIGVILFGLWPQPILSLVQ
jgi:NADH-quinone oxidoreductase subunit N